jgi:hypothetical protein
MRVVRRGAACLAAWTALFWFWMLLVGEWNVMELVAAAVAATLAATAAELVRAAARLRFRLPPRLARALPSALGMVVVDFALVIGVLLRAAWRRELPHGRFVVREFAAGDDDPDSFGTRAGTTFVASLSPNAYVIDVDPERDEVLLHDLVPLRKSEEPA